jgi:hypothetical protein
MFPVPACVITIYPQAAGERNDPRFQKIKPRFNVSGFLKKIIGRQKAVAEGRQGKKHGVVIPGPVQGFVQRFRDNRRPVQLLANEGSLRT